jgi:hypothetical protein
VDPASIGERAPQQPFELSNAAADIVALYAADVTEGTPELPMPDRNGPVHGLFTYTLTRVLTEHAGPMTYRELVQRVNDRYRAEGFGPTPAFEGGGVDREVLSERAPRGRPTFVIEAGPSDTRWTLAAGSIHGLTRGSILEVFPPGGSASNATPIGHVRVIDVRPTTAIVEAIPPAKVSAPRATRIVLGSRRTRQLPRIRRAATACGSPTCGRIIRSCERSTRPRAGAGVASDAVEGPRRMGAFFRR